MLSTLMARKFKILDSLEKNLSTLTHQFNHINLFGVKNSNLEIILVTYCLDDVGAFSTGFQLLAIGAKNIKDLKSKQVDLLLEVNEQGSIKAYENVDKTNLIEYDLISRDLFDRECVYFKLNYVLDGLLHRSDPIRDIKKIQNGKFTFHKRIDILINEKNVFEKETILNSNETVEDLFPHSKSRIELQVHTDRCLSDTKESNGYLKWKLDFNKQAIIHRSQSITKLYDLLRQNVNDNLKLFLSYLGKCLITDEPRIYTFRPSELSEYIFLVYAIHKEDSDLTQTREEYVKKFGLSMLRPILRKGNAILEPTKTSTKLINIHEHVSRPKDVLYLVRGPYAYFHYEQDNEGDSGWGCAYRSFQTLFSFFKAEFRLNDYFNPSLALTCYFFLNKRMKGYTNKNVPSIKDVQECLILLGDKDISFLGSRKWIGSLEISYCLDSMLNVQSKILHSPIGKSIDEIADQLIDYFQRFGAPIMIGSGSLAHTIIGISANSDFTVFKYLVLDPHYPGEENVKTIISKGFCGWKPASFWKKNTFSNLCLPLVPECF